MLYVYIVYNLKIILFYYRLNVDINQDEYIELIVRNNYQ
jgi:hypothetical protein